jgi:peptidoglycan/xylan/chitin deacetylase (PgdA/CDA1 family)
MKNSPWALAAVAFCALFFSGLLISCASRPSALTGPVLDDEPAETFEDEEKAAIELIDEIIQRIKTNSRDIGKYFFLNEDSDIVVKADIDDFEVFYDLRNARPLDGSRFVVDFSVEHKGTGEQRRDSLWWIITADDSGVLLAFDDNHQSVWEQHFGLFDRYGARVTFFIQGEYDPFCREAQNRGHDIGYHTLNHLNLLIVSRETFLEETSSAVETFRREGIPLRSFAYPFGLSEAWMHEELAKSFSVLRGFGVTYRIYRRESIRAGYISSKSIDNIVYKDEEKFEADIALMLRTVKFLGGDGIVPLTTHTIADNADWGISPRRLEYILKTAADLKLRFYRYGDFC